MSFTPITPSIQPSLQLRQSPVTGETNVSICRIESIVQNYISLFLNPENEVDGLDREVQSLHSEDDRTRDLLEQSIGTSAKLSVLKSESSISEPVEPVLINKELPDGDEISSFREVLEAAREDPNFDPEALEVLEEIECELEEAGEPDADFDMEGFSDGDQITQEEMDYLGSILQDMLESRLDDIDEQ